MASSSQRSLENEHDDTERNQNVKLALELDALQSADCTHALAIELLRHAERRKETVTHRDRARSPGRCSRPGEAS